MTNQLVLSHQPALLWLDAEFTGSKPEDGHKLLEVAVVVTDLGLREIDSFESFIEHDFEDIRPLMQMNKFWIGRDDLIARVETSVKTGSPVAEVGSNLVGLCDEYFPDMAPQLAGNSVHNDWLHLRTAMPTFTDRLSHRMVDITTLSTFLEIYYGVPSYSDKKYPHEAMADIRECLDETRYLLKASGVDLNLSVQT